jgi:transposase
VFIKEIKKQNKKDGKIYYAHRLIASYRTRKGPRQQVLLQLGVLDIPKEQWKTLANRIEEILGGQRSLLDIPDTVERLAQHYAQVIIQQKIQKQPEQKPEEKEKPDYHRVDMNSVETTGVRTVGGEYVCLHAMRELQVPEILHRIGLDEQEIRFAMLAIAGRMVKPGSEYATVQWAKHTSGIDELLGTDFKGLGKNALYQIGLKLYEHKGELETMLQERASGLFSLTRKIWLVDLTNTYYEGRGNGGSLLAYGHSKDKRNDCPLVTLGLVVDELGFPMVSRILGGNQRDCQSLKGMIEEMRKSVPERIKPTIIMDAGFATEENLKLIREELGYDYLVVSRKGFDTEEIEGDGLVEINHDGNNTVMGGFIQGKGERILYCESNMRREKEQGIKERFTKRFEAELEEIRASLAKPKGTKKYDKVLERIGRAREKNTWVSHFYTITVSKDEKSGNATDIAWIFDKELMEDRFDGSYYLRTTRTDLSEKELWELYITLTNVEDSFRSMKSDLGLRPIYHRKDECIESHFFMTVLAYHVLHVIRHQLRCGGIRMRWSRLRDRLSTHVRVTTSVITDEGKRISVRNTSMPDYLVMSVYQALNMPTNPLKNIKSIIK